MWQLLNFWNLYPEPSLLIDVPFSFFIWLFSLLVTVLHQGVAISFSILNLCTPMLVSILFYNQSMAQLLAHRRAHLLWTDRESKPYFVTSWQLDHSNLGCGGGGASYPIQKLLPQVVAALDLGTPMLKSLLFLEPMMNLL